MIDPGKLRYPLELQTKPSAASASYDSHGQEIESWSTSATYRGEIKPLTGRALELARQLRADVTHQITTRYFGSIDPKVSRWKYGSRVFEIVSAVDVEERRRETRCICTEVL